MINVTKPFLPPREEYQDYLKGIWERNWLTNKGPLVLELELKLKEYLGIENLLFLSNGTIAIQFAIKALNLKGNIITTPFSYVATTSSIMWEACNPVFVDIDPGTLNINPALIEKAIDENTTGIIATHCFGNACDIDAIAAIAQKYKLKVIYDGAHCFGTKYKNKTVFAYGDVTTASFHATKVFHTTEGGAVFAKDEEVLQRMYFMRNFGHDGPEKFSGVGINGKNSEFHAAMGLCNFKYIDSILKTRKEQSDIYDSLLKTSGLRKQKIQEGCEFNYSYYPVIFPSEAKMMAAKNALENKNIFTRRYFFPSLSNLEYVPKQHTPVSDDISKRILCLPLFHDLSEKEQIQIARIVLGE